MVYIKSENKLSNFVFIGILCHNKTVVFTSVYINFKLNDFFHKTSDYFYYSVIYYAVLNKYIAVIKIVKILYTNCKILLLKY